MQVDTQLLKCTSWIVLVLRCVPLAPLLHDFEASQVAQEVDVEQKVVQLLMQAAHDEPLMPLSRKLRDSFKLM